MLEALKRISEWRVEINQAIPGILNLGFPGYPKKISFGQWVVMKIECSDTFTVLALLRVSIYYRYYADRFTNRHQRRGRQLMAT